MPVLTLSGNEITDAVRAANVQGDGAARLPTSMGIWEATTNLCTNGGFETNITGWNNGTATIVRDLTQAKFGTASGKFVSPGSTNNEYVEFDGITLTSGLVYTVSMWVKGPVGAVLYISFGGPNFPDFVCDGTWQRVTGTVTPASTVMYPIYLATRNSGAAQAVTVYVDGVQVKQKQIATPYVETNGASASRSDARVQAPSSLLNATQGWVAARMRMGSSSAAYNSHNPIFSWEDAGYDNQLVALLLCNGSLGARFQRYNVSGGVDVHENTITSYASGDLITVVMAWTATEVKGSVNGVAFTSSADAHIPPLTTDIWIGESFHTSGTHNWHDGDVLWFAGGTGTLTDADAATLNAFGNNDPAWFALPASATPTLLWYGFDANYLDHDPNLLPPITIAISSSMGW